MNNCWPVVVELLRTDWPAEAEMQTHVTDQDVEDTPPGSVVPLPCDADIMYRADFADVSQPLPVPPQVREFNTTEPGYTTVKFTLPDGQGQCGSDYDARYVLVRWLFEAGRRRGYFRYRHQLHAVFD